MSQAFYSSLSPAFLEVILRLFKKKKALHIHSPRTHNRQLSLSCAFYSALKPMLCHHIADEVTGQQSLVSEMACCLQKPENSNF